MSHKGIRTLLIETARAIRDDVQVSYGMDTDFNQAAKKSDLMIHIDPLSAVPSLNDNQAYTKTWSAIMVFLKPDKAGEIDLYPDILDETDTYVDRFISELNLYSSKTDDIVLSSFSQSAIVKATADRLTGWSLQFQILEINDHEYCVDC